MGVLTLKLVSRRPVTLVVMPKRWINTHAYSQDPSHFIICAVACITGLHRYCDPGANGAYRTTCQHGCSMGAIEREQYNASVRWVFSLHGNEDLTQHYGLTGVVWAFGLFEGCCCCASRLSITSENPFRSVQNVPSPAYSKSN